LRRLLLLRNPRASRGAAELDAALATLRDTGVEVDLHCPEDAEHMRFIIRASARSVDAVAVAGGDGTVNAALKPVLEAGLPLGVVPLGTANDLARTLGIPDDPQRACAVIAAAHRRRIDVGWADNRPFLNAAGIGLSARVARRTSREQKRSWGPLSYPAAVLDAVRGQRAFRVRLKSAGATREWTSIHMAVGNGVYYGGGTPIAESCAIDDGCLDVYSVRPQPLWRLLGVALAVRTGFQERLETGVDVDRGPEFEVTTRPVLTVTLDGEPAMRTPVRFRVAPRSLQVFAPPG
jgi:YegS/Rv2252/BmrU family lipid kinase